MKAIVLTYDRNRVVTEHMIYRYDELWPDHPFVFRIPYQELGGRSTASTEYVRTPPEIRETALQLIADLDDEEWIYWCVDDKYPIQFVFPKINQLMTDAVRSPDISGFLFCRGKALLRKPEVTLYPEERRNSLGDVYLERGGSGEAPAFASLVKNMTVPALDKYVSAALGISENTRTLWLKARMQNKEGKKAEAKKTVEAALAKAGEADKDLANEIRRLSALWP